MNLTHCHMGCMRNTGMEWLQHKPIILPLCFSYAFQPHSSNLFYLFILGMIHFGYLLFFRFANARSAFLSYYGVPSFSIDRSFIGQFGLYRKLCSTTDKRHCFGPSVPPYALSTSTCYSASGCLSPVAFSRTLLSSSM